MDTPLKRARKLRDLTQEEVAAAAGIQQGFYSRLESGHKCPSPKTAAKLAAILSIPVTDILYPEAVSTTGEAA